ncbi:MAG: hypothetical protein HGB11_00230 [Chlorobiales bacterium]|nr:hypothetical protein [Chlorobiales bacterium]
MTTSLVNSNIQQEVIDPFQESVNALLVIAFPKSNSKNFTFALSIAQGATRYAITEIGGRQMYFASFARNQADAGRASALLSYVDSWKGTVIFSSGKVIPNGYFVSQVIQCYLESCSCRDSKAHCQTIIDDPFSEFTQNQNMSISIHVVDRPSIKQKIEIDRYAFPCKYLFSWFRFQKDHPSTPQNQIQAAGVSKGCNICPHFKPDDFKVVGSKIILRELFS